MMKPRIISETVPNLRIKVYHVSVEISQTPIETFLRPLRESSNEYLDKVGEVGTQIVKEILAILGVIEVSIEPYQIQVEKGKAFGWEDIEPGIIGALKKAFGEQSSEVEVTQSPAVLKDEEGDKEDLELRTDKDL